MIHTYKFSIYFWFSPYCTDFYGEMYIEIYIYMCNVECYVLLQLMSFSQNEFSVETAAFTNATNLALSL